MRKAVQRGLQHSPSNWWYFPLLLLISLLLKRDVEPYEENLLKYQSLLSFSCTQICLPLQITFAALSTEDLLPLWKTLRLFLSLVVYHQTWHNAHIPLWGTEERLMPATTLMRNIQKGLMSTHKRAPRLHSLPVKTGNPLWLWGCALVSATAEVFLMLRCNTWTGAVVSK